MAQSGQPGSEPGRAWVIAGDTAAARDKDLSGLACAPDGRCLLVSDEKTGAWLFMLDRSDPAKPKLAITGDIDLKPFADGKEADAEAAGFDGDRFYAIGSHGTSRKKKEFQASRFSVYRIAPDGRSEASGGLTRQLASIPEVAAHLCTAADAGRCETLQDGGANIEGMAVRDGQMFVGFRGSLDGAGRAIVVRVPVASLFDGGAPDAKRFLLPLGKDDSNRPLGIRDMAPVSDGFLVLAGPSLPEEDGRAGAGILFHWTGGDAAPRRLRAIGESGKGVKPEGLLLLREDPSAWTVLVVHDGAEGGTPVEYRVAKP